MKKFLIIISTIISVFLVSCSHRPKSYEFYNDFQKQNVKSLQEVSTNDYNNVTKEENLSSIKVKIGLTHLQNHNVFMKKNDAVINLYFSDDATHEEIEKARAYFFQTFWNGEYHTMNVLPYEDWENRDKIKNLYIQIFNDQNLVLSDNYTFDTLTNDGKKKYKQETTESTEHYFKGSFINIADYLDGNEKQLNEYCNLDEYINLSSTTYIRPNLLNDKIYVSVITEKDQINPKDLNLLYDAIYERYSFLNDNIVVKLFLKDNNMYYEYSSHIEIT